MDVKIRILPPVSYSAFVHSKSAISPFVASKSVILQLVSLKSGNIVSIYEILLSPLCLLFRRRCKYFIDKSLCV